MGKVKNANKVVVKKEEYVAKCKHPLFVTDQCGKCDKEKEELNIKISDKIENFKNLILDLKKENWIAKYVKNSKIIRLIHPKRPDTFFCPVTAVCFATKNKSFGSINFHKAAAVLNMNLEVKYINDAVDCANPDNELSKNFREFLISQFSL